MALQAMWAHGHSATIEVHRVGRSEAEDVNGVPWTAIMGLRLGWGVVYRCAEGSDHWFHFPIPTPAIHDGVRARLRRVTVLFAADAGVTLEAVHLWDGPDRAFTEDGLAVGGENVTLVDGRNSFAIPDRSVQWGIGVSVLFHFAEPGDVTLHGAGVDFES